jgi:hypothetical protein
MKKFLPILFLISTVLPAFSQELQIPEAVFSRMNASFGSASGVEWNPLSNNRYQANFSQNGVLKTALFSSAGNILQLMFPIGAKDFTADVTKTLSQKFPGYEVMEAIRVEVMQEVSFKILIQKGKEAFEIVIDVYGRIKRQAKVESHNEEAICEKINNDNFCERHGKKHKIAHNDNNHGNKNGHKKDKDSPKGKGREMTSL